MSATKTKEELIRLSWLTELRRQGHRKCTRSYARGVNQVCALGLLLEVAGADPNTPPSHEPSMIGAIAGLHPALCYHIVALNDGQPDQYIRQHTFAEIADVAAAWLPK